MKRIPPAAKSVFTFLFAIFAAQLCAQNEVKVALLFGAQSAQCGSTGICHMYVLEDVADAETFYATGILAINGQEATLTVDIHSMKKETLNTHFYNITFVMAERFVLPNEVLIEKNWPPTTILMGEYEYEQLDNSMVVYFHSLQH